jgi:hypothetical protein
MPFILLEMAAYASSHKGLYRCKESSFGENARTTSVLILFSTKLAVVGESSEQSFASHGRKPLQLLSLRTPMALVRSLKPTTQRPVLAQWVEPQARTQRFRNRVP